MNLIRISNIFSFRVIVFIGSFILLQCTQKPQTYTKTTLLNTYCEEIGIPKIPAEEHHVYIFIPRFGCPGTIAYSIQAISNSSSLTDNKDKITLIIDDPQYRYQSWLDQSNIYFDEQAKFEKLDLDIANVTIISVRQSKIESHFSLNKPGDEMELYNLFK
ncbi:MAG: hypothetical protein WD077_10120 [Bacteroidia bacterium]